MKFTHFFKKTLGTGQMGCNAARNGRIVTGFVSFLIPIPLM